MYYLHYNETTGLIIGAPYHSAVHGKEVPVYNEEQIKDDEENVINEIGTVQTGTALDLSAIPQPYAEITDSEHDDWMQNQATRKIDIENKKLIEYTSPEQPPVIVTPSIDQSTADMWEAILEMSAELEVLKGGK